MVIILEEIAQEELAETVQAELEEIAQEAQAETVQAVQTVINQMVTNQAATKKEAASLNSLRQMSGCSKRGQAVGKI